MNDDLIPFQYQDHQVRTISKNGEPWFVLKDVSEILSIQNHKDISSRLDIDEKGVDAIDTLGGVQYMTTVNESGLYNVILRSDKPEAKQFRKWITSEVLPSIRRHGMYAISKPLSQLEIMHQMTGALIEQERKIKTLSGQIECVQTFLQDTCDIINLNPLKWREDCNRLVASIAKKRGGFQHIEEVWTEIYDAIDSRMNTNLSTRVENMKKRMEINGAGKAKIKAANKLDVIGQNSRLIEGTCHIVKQLAIKNGVGVS